MDHIEGALGICSKELRQESLLAEEKEELG